jgi:hypothetical protein
MAVELAKLALPDKNLRRGLVLFHLASPFDIGPLDVVFAPRLT